MVANIFYHLDLLLPIVLPIVDIIDTLLLLESLQKLFVFDCDPLSILVASCRVQRFGNGLKTPIPQNVALGVRDLSAPLRLVGRDWRHISLLVLREVGTRAC